MLNTQKKWRAASERARRALERMTDEEDAAATAAADDEKDTVRVHRDDPAVSAEARKAAQAHGIEEVLVRKV